MIRLTYQIDLHEPLLLAGLEGDPNSSISLDFLAGSALRGTLIGLYLQERGRPELDLSNTVEHRLFFDGQTRYLNGYVRQRWESRTLQSLPTPRSWYRPKHADKKSEIYDFAIEIPPKRHTNENGKIEVIQYKPLKTPYVITPESAPSFLTPTKQLRIQTSRDRDYGRATAANGAVYRYQSLRKGQTFIAHILCKHEEDADILRPLLDRRGYIGGARSSDYGRVQLSLLDEDEEADEWSEIDDIYFREGDLPPTTAIVTLLSDMLVRDATTGRLTTNPHAIATALGITVAREDADFYVAHRPIGGFNRKWGLPLPQMVAFKMGSVFVYRNLSPETVERLQDMRSVGEQQLDGFGRITVNWHTQKTLEPYPEPEQLKGYLPAPQTIRAQPAVTLARRMVQRRLRHDLDRKLLAKVDDTVRKKSNRTKAISKSQLYRLRQSVQASLQTILQDGTALQDERTALQRVLDDIKGRKSAERQFAKARIEGETMLKWVGGVIDQPSFVFTVNQDDYPQLGSNVTASADAALIYEYNLRYLDAVLGRIAKAKQEDN